MKHSEAPVWLMLADSAAFPAIVGLARLFGYKLRAGSGVVYAAAAAALTVFCAVRLFRSRDRQLGKAAAAALSATPLLTQIQTLCFALYVQCFPSTLLLSLLFWLAAAVTAAFVKPAALKAVSYTLSGLLVLPVCLFIFLSGFGHVEAVTTAVSPQMTWCAEVIEHDEGALGGSVSVVVYKYRNSAFSIGSFDFRKERELYRGSWGSPRELCWLDDEHLKYNLTTYALTSP